jgi:hypothetical protein
MLSKAARSAWGDSVDVINADPALTIIASRNPASLIGWKPPAHRVANNG